MSLYGDVYSRQAALYLQRFPKIAVVGCGGVGAWIGMFSALGGAPSIHLYDFDNLDETNLNRLPYPKTAIGSNKAQVLKAYIETIRPETETIAYSVKIDDETKILLKNFGVVFDATDRTLSHQYLENLWLNRHFSILIRASYDGEHYTIAKNTPIERDSWTAMEVDGYTIIPSWAVSASFVAEMACWVAYSSYTPESCFISQHMKEFVNILRFCTVNGYRKEGDSE